MMEREVVRNQQNTAPVEIHGKGLSPDAKAMFDSIARRAYELFESNGRTRGRDLDNWIAAEAELFRPAPFKMAESKNGWQVEVDVHGFMPGELEVDLEPLRVTVIGKHHTRETRRISGGGVSEENYNHLLRCLRLPAEIDTVHARARFDRGILHLDLRRLATM